MKKRKKGFTLIELMIVIAIIAILAAVLVPNFMRAREASRLTACKSNLKNISTAVETYSNDNDGVYPGDTSITDISSSSTNASLKTLAQTYIGKTLNCPAGAKPYRYQLVTASGAGYWIYCPAVTSGSISATATRKHRKNNQDGGPVFDSATGIQEKFQ
jgi:prepilin-type N-terminal cleavage/methylation domain-containing protein